MGLFVSGNNSIAGLEAKLPKIHVITDPNELRLKKGQWFVKTHEIVKPLSKCSRARLLAKIIFKTLFSLGFCWLAESTKREASFFKEKRKVVPIYSPLESLPKKAEPKPVDKQDDDDLPVLEDADFEGKAQPAHPNQPPPNKIEAADLELDDGGHMITDAGIAHLKNLQNLKQLDLANAGPVLKDAEPTQLKNHANLKQLDLANAGPDFIDRGNKFKDLANLGLLAHIPLVNKAVQAPNNQGGGAPVNPGFLSNNAAYGLLPFPKMKPTAPLNIMGGAKAGQGLPGDMPFGQIPAHQNFHQFAVDVVEQAMAQGPDIKELHLADAPLLQNLPPFPAFNIADFKKIHDDGVKEAQAILAAADAPIGGAKAGQGLPGDMLPDQVPTHAKVNRLALAVLGLGQAVQEAPVKGLQPVGDILKADPDVVFQVADFAFPITNPEDIDDVGLAVIITQNPHITSLDLSKTLITEKGLAHLKALKNLRELDLRGLAIGNGLKHIAECTQLKSLNLSFTTIKNEDLNALGALKKLQHLDLSLCGNLTVNALQELQDCNSIESLNLSNCKFNDFWFPYLSNFPLLRKLDLTGCKNISPLGLSALKEIKNLQELDLSFCNTTNEHLAALKEFKALQTLILRNNSKVTLEGFVELGKVTSLKKLKLSNCKNLNTEGFAAIKGLTGLQELDLSNSIDQVTDECLAHLEDFKNLKKLNLFCCAHITDLGLAVLKNFEKMEELDLSCNAEITDVTLSYLKELKHLRKLSLMSAKKVTDSGMADLGSIESLQTLDLTGLTITNAGLAKLVTLKNLETLILVGCSKIGVSSLETLKMMPALKHAQLLYTKISPQEAKVLRDRGIKTIFGKNAV